MKTVFLALSLLIASALPAHAASPHNAYTHHAALAASELDVSPNTAVAETGAPYQLAGIYWLPDYLKSNIDTNHRTDVDTGGGDIPLGCEKYSPKCNSPHILGGIEVRAAGDLFCPVECVCPDSYKYTSSNCSGDKKPSGSVCDGKYNDCRSLTCEERGLKTCGSGCIAVSACCTDTDCGSGKKCSSGSCINKTCEEMGQKTCNGSCIAVSACCTDTDCGSGKKCSSGSCIDKTCEEMGQKTCNGSCIAASACCTDTDCGSGKKCSSGSCIDKTCEEMGQKNCGGKCIAKTACCVSGDCASGMKCFDNICIAQTCEDKGLKTCNGSCITVSECCGGCQPNETCKNGVCVNNETCLSQIMSSGNYAQDANGVIYSKSAPNTAYVIADGAMPFKNPGIAETVKDYRYVYGPSKLAQFSKCAALPVPTLTATSTGFESAEWILNKSLDGVNVKLAGSASYYIDATVVWDNVKFLSSGSGTVEINSPGNVTLGLNADFGTNNGLQYNIRDGAKMTVKGPASGTPVHKAKLLAVWTTAKLTTSGNIDFGTLDNSGTSNSIQAGEYKGEVIVRRGSLTFGSGVKHTGGTVAVYTDAKFYGSGATLNKVAADGYISLSNTTVSDSVSVNFSGGGETSNSNGEAYLNNVTTPKLTIDGGIARLYGSGVNTVYVKPWGALHIISNANVNALVLNDYSSTNKVPANLFLYQNARLDVYSLKMNQSAKIRMNYGSYLQVQYMDMCYQNTDGWRTQICYYGVPSGGSVAQINYRGTITKGTTGGRNTRATKNSCIINPGFGTSNSDDNNYWECDWDNSSKGNWYFDTMKNKYRCCK